VALDTYELGGGQVDSVDLKALVVSRGVRVADAAYRAFAGSARLSPDPLTCNCLLLPDGTVVQMTDLAVHMRYVRSAMSWDMLKQVRYLSQLKTPFTVELVDGAAMLCHDGRPVTEVCFPPPSSFYERRTSSGLPYLGNAVLQGTDWVSFQCLWPCDYARAGQSCQYCYSGGVFEALQRRHKPMPPSPTPGDAAEIARCAILGEPGAGGIQITGGSTFDTDAEVARIASYLEAIDRLVGRERIRGEIVVYARSSSTACSPRERTGCP